MAYVSARWYDHCLTQDNLTPFLQAIAAAALFGVSAPFAKLFLGEVEPIPLAAFLYLGSGLGLLLIKTGQRLGGTAVTTNTTVATETPIERSDLLWLAGAILAGGIAAPIIWLFSLHETPAATAAPPVDVAPAMATMQLLEMEHAALQGAALQSMLHGDHPRHAAAPVATTMELEQMEGGI